MAESISANSRLLPGRVRELDGIRGIAILMVVIFHLPLGFRFGATGVDLFFVLSGYLITGIILRNRAGPHFFARFFTRRALRIWPIYYLTIGVVLVVNSMRHHPYPIDGLPWYLCYVQYTWAYVHGVARSMPHLDHTWTLAVEEQFYLLWPVLLYLFRGRNAFRLMVVIGVLLPIVLRMSDQASGTLLTHSDTLVLGALLAAYEWGNPGRDRNRDARSFGAAVVVSVILYLLVGYAMSGERMPGWTTRGGPIGASLVGLIYFTIVGFIVAQAGQPRLAPLRVRGLVYVGQISYGLYLYHWVIYEWVDVYLKFRLGIQDTWWMDLIKVAASFAVAIASFELVEKRILTFKDRLRYGERLGKAGVPVV